MDGVLASGKPEAYELNQRDKRIARTGAS